MPNHIKNRVTINAEIPEIDVLIKRFGTYVPASLRRTWQDNEIICRKKDGDYGWFDERKGIFKKRTDKGFSEVMGLPEGFEFEIDDACFVFPDFEKIIPMPEEIKKSIGEPGISPDWYDWSCKNWGTKWNSYSHERLALNVFQFETAWSNVANLLKKMTKDFIGTIFYEWSDEDTGNNCGNAILKDGKSYINKLENESVEAYELAFKLRPDRAEWYRLEDGKYSYIEEN